jgi:hypothetical protein
LARARFAPDQTPFLGGELRSIGGKGLEAQAAMWPHQN